MKFSYGNWPSSKKADFADVYDDPKKRMGEFSFLSLDSALKESLAFSSLANPSWTRAKDWSYKGIVNDKDFKLLSARSIMARTIYAENIHAGKGESRQNAMLATANVIKNRVANPNYKNDGKSVVLDPCAFSCMSDGNIGVSNPAYFSSDIHFWLYALTLADHMFNAARPIRNNLPSADYLFFYNVSNSMPFYIYKKEIGTFIPCTLENIVKATHFKYRQGYYKIAFAPVLFDKTAFYGWNDR
ncbi:MAG: cell wall hydrolase [Clostridiales bacterium]|jgi:hypothetical protein|nr:cell wall hydrolase [Clostridiales bacterium]